MAAPDAQSSKTFLTYDFGKEDGVKETHQGCLSRSINQFFKLFEV